MIELILKIITAVIMTGIVAMVVATLIWDAYDERRRRRRNEECLKMKNAAAGTTIQIKTGITGIIVSFMNACARQQQRERQYARGRGLKMDKGELIRCRDAEDCIHTMCELEKEGIHTDFVFEYEGEEVFWLKVTGKTLAGWMMMMMRRGDQHHAKKEKIS